jgi:hypothetical protein
LQEFVNADNRAFQAELDAAEHLGEADPNKSNSSYPEEQQTGTAQTGTAQTGTAQTGTAQTGTAQTGTAQTGTAQTGTAQTGTAQTGIAQTGTAGNRHPAYQRVNVFDYEVSSFDGDSSNRAQEMQETGGG